MSTSLLVLMGSTKIAFVSYVYSINMYCISLLLVNGKHLVKSIYTFPVSGFARPIAENTRLVFSSLWVEKYVSISSINCSLFASMIFFLFDPNVKKKLASDFGRFAAIISEVSTDHVEEFPIFTASIKFDYTGMKYVACKKTC